MSLTGYINFQDAIADSIKLLRVRGQPVDAGHWQGIPTEGKPDLQTLEYLNLGWITHMPNSLQELQRQIKPNLPWADLEFEDRVSHVPMNPHRSLEHWPYWRGQVEQTQDQGKFTHTYSERFWPKDLLNVGIRWGPGDLDDVVGLLLRSPCTRQAYLPIFFPEDTGAVHGGRIPCTLGYHFMLRGDELHVWYEIRSCDAVRHFRDDLYLAARLALWVLEELQDKELTATPDGPTVDSVWYRTRPGNFTFLAHSFHVHKGDLHHLEPR